MRTATTSTPDTGSLEVDESVIAQKTRKPLFSIGKTIKPSVVMAFSRQLSSFLEAGIPLLDGLEIVGQQTASPAMRKVIDDIRASISRGTGFAEAVDAHPLIFPAFYRAMLTSAEYTGDLDDVLSQLAAYLERDITLAPAGEECLDLSDHGPRRRHRRHDRDVALRAAQVHRPVQEPRRKPAVADAHADRLHELHAELLAVRTRRNRADHCRALRRHRRRAGARAAAMSSR